MRRLYGVGGGAPINFGQLCRRAAVPKKSAAALCSIIGGVVMSQIYLNFFSKAYAYSTFLFAVI